MSTPWTALPLFPDLPKAPPHLRPWELNLLCAIAAADQSHARIDAARLRMARRLQRLGFCRVLVEHTAGQSAPRVLARRTPAGDAAVARR